MIPRWQRTTFWVLVVLCVLMSSYLFLQHRRNTRATDLSGDDTPIAAPETSAAENVSYLIARDDDGSIVTLERAVALPANSDVRTRALLEHLLADYSLPDSQHKLPGGIAVDDVFLVPLPLTAKSQASSKAPQLPTKAEDADPLTHASGELAIVNLRSSWVDTHPSGAEVETLTIQSIIGTMHANLPEITQIRFLVDGAPRETLAGHVNLLGTFPSVDTSTARP